LNSFYREVTEIVSRCLEQGIMVRFISDSFYLLRNLKLANSRLEKFGDNIVISVHKGADGRLAHRRQTRPLTSWFPSC